MSTIRIATRRSPLALWQAEYVKAQLEQHHPGIEVTLVPMVTKGDRIIDSPLAKIGGKGLFVKELEAAMMEQRADIAVHSMKDVPAVLPDGLEIAVICPREDPTDAFVSNQFAELDDLPQGARVGTASLRRQVQLLAMRPDLEILPLRGNVGTRLGKLDADEYDAIILASAGLKRLGLGERITQPLKDTQLLPAVGQGAVGIECRSDDAQTQSLLKPLNDQETQTRVLAERAMNHQLRGGCQVPIAGFATLLDSDQLLLRGLVGDPDSQQLLTAQAIGHHQDAESIGRQVAQDLIEQGADRIIDTLLADSDH